MAKQIIQLNNSELKKSENPIHNECTESNHNKCCSCARILPAHDIFLKRRLLIKDFPRDYDNISKYTSASILILVKKE